MLYNLLKTLHVLAIILWIGGMIYTLFFLRPAVASLDGPARVKLMHDVLARFFKAVLWAATIAVGSGIWMLGRVAKQTVQAGGSFSMPTEWIVMAALGILMFLIFGHIRFALFKRLQRAVAASDWAAGGIALNTIRQWVMINLGIGIVIVCVTLIGLPK
ncbi:MAG: CopD family protein [Casimicrobium sp.]